MASAVYRGLAVAALLLASGGGCRRPAADSGAAPATVRVAETRPLMGVAWTITVFAADRATGERAIARGFAEARRLEQILSDYDPDSELSRLSAAAPTADPVAVSAELWDVLCRSAEITGLTDGAFDVTVGPLTTLWRQSRRSGHLPRPDKLAAARAAVGRDGLVLQPKDRTVTLTRPAMRLDLGGIGMGYAADRVLAVLTRHGIAAALVDASGDVVVSGPPPESAGWRIRVDGLPGAAEADLETIELAHAAVTTSGDARQFMEIDGRRFSHVVDPRTGLGVAGPAAVTVIAADGATADAVATAASVLGHEAGPRAVARFPGVSARFVWRDGEAVKSVVTPGWPGR